MKCPLVYKVSLCINYYRPFAAVCPEYISKLSVVHNQCWISQPLCVWQYIVQTVWCLFSVYDFRLLSADHVDNYDACRALQLLQMFCFFLSSHPFTSKVFRFSVITVLRCNLMYIDIPPPYSDLIIRIMWNVDFLLSTVYCHAQ